MCKTIFQSAPLERNSTLSVPEFVEIQRRQFSAVHAAPISENKETKQYHNEKRRRRKVSRAAFCASAMLQRGKDFLVASIGRSERGAVPGQEDGRDRGEGSRMQPNAQEEEEETVQSSSPCGGKVPGEVRAHCSIVRLARRREGRGVQSLADHSSLPLTGCSSVTCKVT